MNINQIQKERKDILYNLNPYEMEAYIKILINRLYESPEELLGCNASWAYSFTEEAIMRAVRSAR